MIDKHDLMHWKTAGNIVECRMLDKVPPHLLHNVANWLLLEVDQCHAADRRAGAVRYERCWRRGDRPGGVCCLHELALAYQRKVARAAKAARTPRRPRPELTSVWAEAELVRALQAIVAGLTLA